MKDAYYFSHDANAQDDEKILDLRADYGWEGYGLYWAVIELMRNQSDYMLDNGERIYKKLAIKFNVKEEFMENFINDCCEYGLFVNENGKIYSESFLERMGEYEKRKQAARKAANARWNNDSNADEDAKEKQELCDRIAQAIQSVCDGNASKVKESKVNEIKDKLKDKDYIYAEGIIKIFNCWKEFLSDINDARLTKNCMKVILTKLKKWDKDKIIEAIKNYNEILRSDYYYSHNFTLQKFIKQSNGVPKFVSGLDQKEDGCIWKDYKTEHKSNNDSDVLDDFAL